MLTPKQKYQLIHWIPFLGKYVRKQVDLAFIKELKSIEERFSSPLVRFDTLIFDLYDCLNELKRPLQIDPRDFHGYDLLIHTRSSNSISSYLERIYENENLNIDTFFNVHANPRRTPFLNWYSNDETVELFIDQMIGLLGLLCVKSDRKEWKPDKLPENNEALARLYQSRWIKLLIKDVIQLLVTVLGQRTGG